MEKIKVGIVGTGYTVGMADAHVKGYCWTVWRQ